ncbi:predicted protein [Pyrenophora tritici-repentis Pt-1C-BFP]|uniref:Uncharacterized protein n=1 Tax=Pyrenophora tritici-repentis (strain Pt-1C-BFP) TaxID=426418 RepID=B2W0P9_PYRTR|nr:uncharacterized protein PTRG_04034 [Pyrenophora tritici-repentis Pt-1C-BFP]EDU46872.1 predicted protein [Pyrenophora tritici-repentis Pt-1C-BFP]
MKCFLNVFCIRPILRQIIRPQRASRTGFSHEPITPPALPSSYSVATGTAPRAEPSLAHAHSRRLGPAKRLAALWASARRSLGT